MKPLDVVLGDDPAAKNDDVGGPFAAQRLDDGREERVVRAAHDGETNRVDVLLNRGAGDHLRRLVKTRVDDLEARVAQGTGDDLCPAIVAVEAGFGYQNADVGVGHDINPWRARSRSRPPP